MILLHLNDNNRIYINPRRVIVVMVGIIVLNDGSTIDFAADINAGVSTRLVSRDIAEDIANFLSGDFMKSQDTANLAHALDWTAGPAYVVSQLKATFRT